MAQPEQGSTAYGVQRQLGRISSLEDNIRTLRAARMPTITAEVLLVQARDVLSRMSRTPN